MSPATADSLFYIIRSCVSSDASPAYIDSTGSDDTDASVAFDSGDFLALDLGNDADMRSGSIVRLAESVPAVDYDVSRFRNDSAVFFPDTQLFEDLDMSRYAAFPADPLDVACLDSCG